MPIILSDRDYPQSFKTLEQKGISLIPEERAIHQDIRPLRIAFLNLMPSAVLKDTEEHWFALVGGTPIQIIPELVCLDDESLASDARRQYLNAFYRSISQIKAEGVDGLIITGANVGDVPFEQVRFFEQLCEIIDWAHENVASTLYSCWAAHAALYHRYGIKREQYYKEGADRKKITGVFTHELPDHLVSPLTRGLSEEVQFPHSRWNGIPRAEVEKKSELQILLESKEAGICLLTGRKGREVYIQGHPEYEANALAKEFFRDRAPDRFGENAPFPVNCFPSNDLSKTPRNHWRSHARVLFDNWINYVYQTTHFDLRKPVMGISE